MAVAKPNTGMRMVDMQLEAVTICEGAAMYFCAKSNEALNSG